MRKVIEIAGDRHLETLGNCGGYYACPIREGTGERMGPLVGYAGTYEGQDGKKLQFVGDIYANFAKAEVHTNVLRFFAECLAAKLDSVIGIANVDVLVGAPIGGYALATALGITTGLDVIKAEKKVTAVATSTSREKSDLMFGRHSVQEGEQHVIVEDVCNNFSTTEKLIDLISSGGGDVIAILCFLNRSLTVDAQYYPKCYCDLPVVGLVRLPINEWRQDDSAVAADIASGNVVWKPKDEWDRLMQACTLATK